MTMDKITGNYLMQANRDFPLDCETLDYLQTLAALAALAGNIGGDRVVLRGCEPSSDGAYRAEGYVFLRTAECPDGEILRWEGGPTTGGMYLKQEDTPVSANNVEYPKAYTRRSLAAGVGSESFDWESFADLKSVRELMAENAGLRAELAKSRRSPVGMVEMWAGSSVPEDYVLCDGRALRAEEYPELYGALGTAFNAGVNANGSRFVTDAGYFRVPDLRGRFIAGRHDSDADYQQTGSAGGKKLVALTEGEMPAHTHTVKDYYYAQAHSTMTRLNVKNFDQIPAAVTGNGGIGDTASDDDNDCMPYHKHESTAAGEGLGHENRPPYYVLAYVMRAR